MHTAATAALTAYHVDEHGRGTVSITAFGILPHFTGTAVHDAYSGYNAFTGCLYALCNAHVIRESAAINEFDPAARDDGWAAAFLDLLGDAHQWAGAWRKKGHPGLLAFKAADLRRHWDMLVERGMTAHPSKPGRQASARNLVLRLRDRREEFLRFTGDFTIGFSNNTAEQAIRMIKAKAKVSGGFRTLTGARTFLPPPGGQYSGSGTHSVIGSVPVEDAFAEQVGVGPAIHLPLDHFDAVHVAFDGSGAVRQRQASSGGVEVAA